MTGCIYTIGYSGFKIADFITILKHYQVDVIIDVRSLAFSKRFTNYNKGVLEHTLNEHKIHYRNYAIEFGARQINPVYYPRGYLDFDLFSQSIEFLSGVEKIVNSMKKNYSFALMCSEKDPLTCHRAILVSRAFHKLHYNVKHLLPNNEVLTQENLEVALLNKFFPNRNQLTLFDENLSEKEYINLAYANQNKLIAYSLYNKQEQEQ